jgi:hypothetical protein
MVARLSLQLFLAFAVEGCNRHRVEMLPRQSRRSEFCLYWRAQER